jgi:hypothetical protein
MNMSSEPRELRCNSLSPPCSALAQGRFLVAQGLERLVERQYPQTTSSPQTHSVTRWVYDRWTVSIAPFAEDALQVFRDALENHSGNRYKGTVLHASGQDGVLLCEFKCVMERGVLSLCAGTNNDV